MRYHGDILEDEILYFEFNTRDTDFAPITLAGTPSLAVYKDDGTAQSTAGLTLTVDHDSITGKHMVKVDTSADAFYVTGADYSVVIAAGTVDAISVVGSVVGSFSIENRNNEAVVTTNNDKTGYALSTAGNNSVRDAIFAYAVAGTVTFVQAVRAILAMLTGKTSGAGTGTVTMRNHQDTLDALIFTMTGSNRTARTDDLSA